MKKKAVAEALLSKRNVMVVVLAVTFMYSLADCRELGSSQCDIAIVFTVVSRKRAQYQISAIIASISCKGLKFTPKSAHPIDLVGKFSNAT